MRRLAAVLWLFAAACSVPLEGAPCTSDANCPDSQRCDTATQACVTCEADPACTADGTFCIAGDTTHVRTCSTTIGGCRYGQISACLGAETCGGTPGQAACDCPQPGSNAGDGCASAGAQACDPASRNVITCVQQGSCTVWEAAAGTTCTSQGLVCDASGGSPICVCDSYSGNELYADPVSGKPASHAIRPTGAATPATCRFRSLTDALTAASAGRTVRMAGWTSGEIVFSAAASGETFPLQVKPGVALLTTDATPAPANYVVEVDQAGPTRPVLQLDHDSGASGFTVRPATGGSASHALWVNCASAGSAPVALSGLVLDGRGALVASVVDEGLRLSGSCSVSAASLLVQKAAKTGIRVLSSTTGATVSIANCSIRGNGDSGLIVNVDASMGAPSLSVSGNDITGNDGATPYPAGAVIRRAGGVVLHSAVPASFTFSGNAVYGNSFDQVLVYSSNAWEVSAGACGALANTFACYDAANGGYGLSAIGGGAVNAEHEYWANLVPSSGTDYFQANGSVITASSPCGASTLICP